VQREIALAGSQGYNWDFQDGLALLEQGRLDLKSLITHPIRLEELQAGFELLCSPESHAIKVVAKIEEPGC
jgi:threonine dehydrogenase-like Zn-dependent dehydrogenase